MSDLGKHPLRPLCEAWLDRIRLAQKFKRAEFGDDAEEAMNFFDGPANWMWTEEYMRGKRGYRDQTDTFGLPKFRVQSNRVAEMEQIFGPALYPRNPHRRVTVRPIRMPNPLALGGDPNDPNMQMMAQQLDMQVGSSNALRAEGAAVLEEHLNYVSSELNHKWHIRRAITEALIKGLGVVWSEVKQPPGFQGKLVGWRYESVDGLVFDHDADDHEDILWMARECCHSIDSVEREYGLLPGALEKKGSFESLSQQADLNKYEDGPQKRREGRSKDILRYWKIYSKTGLGNRYIDKANRDLRDIYDEVADQLGEYVYLVVAEGVPYPLNMPPPELSVQPQSIEESFLAAQWPVPFWADGGWPCELFAFHWKPGSIYPISHVKPGIGELKFINWAMSFLGDKVASSAQLFMGVSKGAAQNIRERVADAARSFGIVEIEDLQGKAVSDLISYIKPPEMNQAIWQLVAAVSAQFEKRVGLIDLMYGIQGIQSRSATDANTRQQNANIRIDDMFQMVRQSLKSLAKKEALAMRWLYEPQDIAIAHSQGDALVWQQTMMNADLERMVREYEFDIEPGEQREPSKETQIEQANASLQTLGPILTPFAQMGLVDPQNALVAEWCKANDVEPAPFMLPQPPPQPPVQEQPPPEQGV